MSATIHSSHSPPVEDNFPTDTLDLLFNQEDGILVNSVQKQTEMSVSDPASTYNGGLLLSDTDLDALLNSSADNDLNGGDILEEILASPHESSSPPGDDSMLGSPPFIPPSIPSVMPDPNVVSRDHSYIAGESNACHFNLEADEDIKFINTHNSSPAESSHVDIPEYINDDLDCLESKQHSAPGPMRHIKRSRGSSSSYSSLPYTIHDLPAPTGSPSSDDDVSRSSGNSRYNADESFGSPGDRLVLSDEERFLLAKEGMELPDRLPLTREEERVLRTVRRKIRNKISAKNSRLKKQEYVVGLEQRVKMCSKENRSLRGSVDSLRSQNRQLVSEVRRLRQWISEKFPNMTGPLRAGGPAKAGLYALFLSFALVLTPMISPFWKSSIGGEVSPVLMDKPGVMPGRTRTLLQEREAAVDVGDPYRITVRPAGLPWQHPPKTAAIKLPPPPLPAASASASSAAAPPVLNSTTPAASPHANGTASDRDEMNEETVEDENDQEARAHEL